MATQVAQVQNAVKRPCSASLHEVIYGAAFYRKRVVLTLNVQPLCWYNL